MKCLYCGKGIGPIRQLRDPEFCSEAHRAHAHERYRQDLYAALAPEPGPAQIADFIERPPAGGGRGPAAVLCALPKAPAGECLPAMHVDAAGVALEHPDWILGKTLADSPKRLVWQDSSAAYRSPMPSVSFSIRIPLPERPAAGATVTRLVAGNPAARPRAAEPGIPQPNRSVPYHCVSLPEAAQIPAPVKAQLSSPQLQAAAPGFGELAAVGHVPPTVRAAVAPSSYAAIAVPAPPPAAQPTPEVSLSPATIAAQHRPVEAGQLMVHSDNGAPVAFDAPGSQTIGIVLPTPPAAAAHSSWLAAMQRALHSRSVRPAPHADAALLPAVYAPRAAQVPSLPGSQLQSAKLPMAPMAPTADPQPAGMPAASLSWHAARTDESSSSTGPLGSHAAPRVECSAVSGGALAELLQPGTSPVQEAAGNRNLRTVPAAPAPIRTLSARHELSALPGGMLELMGSAPPCQAEMPAPATPPEAGPSWDAARAILQNRPLVPLAELAVARTNYVPEPAGALAGMGLPLLPAAARAVRSNAVLWTLRAAHVCDPIFRMDPIRAKFNDLLRSDRSMPYSPDFDGRDRAKSNVLAFKRADPRRSKLKWQYAAAAAAALLVAGVLRPQVAPKSLSASLPWRGISIRQWMSQRATRNFADDFRAGLNQWKSVQPKWPNSWSYNSDGFIHPGQLALYRPSAPLSDYKFEFMAQVETKSVDWVVRAKDANNYYALKFTVLEPGPRPIVAMVRYPVIGGNKGSRVQTPLRMMIHANTPYRVTVDVKGNHYRTYIEDQEADFWTDDRLKTGGVGFFSETGERARVYWVKLESHGDILGRICGLLSGKSGASAKDKQIQAMDYRHAGTDPNGAAGGGAEAIFSTAQETRIGRVLSNAVSLHQDGKLDEADAELVRAMDALKRRPPLYFARGQLQII